MTVLDDSYHPAGRIESVSTQKAFLSQIPGLTYPLQAADTGRSMLCTHCGKRGCNHQHNETNAEVSDLYWLLPGQVCDSRPRSVSFTHSLDNREQHDKTDRRFVVFQLQGQQEAGPEFGEQADWSTLEPGMMVRRAQRSRSLQMRFERETHEA